MKRLAILPRGGLGDVLYHALFAKVVQQHLPDLDPVLIAPKYGAFLTELLQVRHWAVESVLTDASRGCKLRNEAAFIGTLLRMRGQYLASFTNDVVDAGLALAFGLKRFDRGLLGNAALFVETAPGGSSRSRLNRMLHYTRSGRVNPRHIVERQQCALGLYDLTEPIAHTYQKVWKTATAHVGAYEQPDTVLLFPETARLEKDIRPEQIETIVQQLQGEYKVRIFTANPGKYASLPVAITGFADRLDPIRHIRGCAGVITADTFAAHLAGLCGVPACTIYNFAYMPLWCEYWGAPFQNVLHFEDGQCYRLSDGFRAARTDESSVLFRAALAASGMTCPYSEQPAGQQADQKRRAREAASEPVPQQVV